MTERPSGYFRKLEEIATRMSSWAAKQEPILDRLSREVEELKTPESRALYEAELDQIRSLKEQGSERD